MSLLDSAESFPMEIQKIHDTLISKAHRIFLWSVWTPELQPALCSRSPMRGKWVGFPSCWYKAVQLFIYDHVQLAVVWAGFMSWDCCVIYIYFPWQNKQASKGCLHSWIPCLPSFCSRVARQMENTPSAPLLLHSLRNVALVLQLFATWTA